jgi:hypothetical protein
MSFGNGNQLWKLRAKHGRDALFATPELLMESALEYFQHCDNDISWNTTKYSESEKGTYNEVKYTKRPYTRGGLFLYLKCSESWLREFKKTCSVDFLRVIEEIETIIDTQQVEGAMIGAFNSNLVARIQGIKEQTDLTTNGKEINTAPFKVEIVKPIDESDNCL